MVMFLGILIISGVLFVFMKNNIPPTVNLYYSFDGENYYQLEQNVLTCKSHENKEVYFKIEPAVKGVEIECWRILREEGKSYSIWSSMLMSRPKTNADGEVNSIIHPCYGEGTSGYFENGTTSVYTCFATIPNKLRSHEIHFNAMVVDPRYPAHG